MFLYFAIFLPGIYFLLIVYLIIGWKRNFTFEPKGNEELAIEISIIVACKNEEKNIRQLISNIAQQSYRNYQLIIVDDHSTDYTQKYITDAIQNFPNMQYHAATGNGKKNAIWEGVQLVKSELIVTLDADCIPKYHWLESIVCFWEKYRCDMIICPIKLAEKDNLVARLQYFEFTSLVATGASMAGAGTPILCNGANLAFTKSVWEHCKDDLQFKELSGDDIFLLQSVKRNGRKIRFLKSESAFVTTRFVDSVSQFVSQRRRWAGKSTSYTDWQIILVALAVFFTSAFEFVLLLLSFLDVKYLVWFAAYFGIKFLLDFTFLSRVGKFFHLEKIFLYSLLLSVVYPFYIVLIGGSALLLKPKKW